PTAIDAGEEAVQQVAVLVADVVLGLGVEPVPAVGCGGHPDRDEPVLAVAVGGDGHPVRGGVGDVEAVGRVDVEDLDVLEVRPEVVDHHAVRAGLAGAVDAHPDEPHRPVSDLAVLQPPLRGDQRLPGREILAGQDPGQPGLPASANDRHVGPQDAGLVGHDLVAAAPGPEPDRRPRRSARGHRVDLRSGARRRAVDDPARTAEPVSLQLGDARVDVGDPVFHVVEPVRRERGAALRRVHPCLLDVRHGGSLLSAWGWSARGLVTTTGAPARTPTPTTGAPARGNEVLSDAASATSRPSWATAVPTTRRSARPSAVATSPPRWAAPVPVKSLPPAAVATSDPRSAAAVPSVSRTPVAEAVNPIGACAAPYVVRSPTPRAIRIPRFAAAVPSVVR